MRPQTGMCVWASVAVEEALVPISCAGVVGECPVYGHST